MGARTCGRGIIQDYMHIGSQSNTLKLAFENLYLVRRHTGTRVPPATLSVGPQ
jgi:hypothetical protein